jgi:hypothetical protein
MGTVLPTVKNGQVAMFLFALGLVIPLIVAVFAIKWGWHAVWSVAQGKTDIMTSHYTDVSPAHDNKIGADPIVREPVIDTYKVAQTGGQWEKDTQKLKRGIADLKAQQLKMDSEHDQKVKDFVDNFGKF